MRMLARSRAVWFLAAAMVVFWAMWFGLGFDATYELTSSLRFGAAIMLTITWAAPCWYGLRSAGADQGEGLLQAGLFFMVLTVSGWGAYGIAYRWMGRPEWLLQTPIGSFLAWSLFCSCVLIMFAPGTRGGVIPMRNWIYLLIATAIGSSFFTATVMWFLLK